MKTTVSPVVYRAGRSADPSPIKHSKAASRPIRQAGLMARMLASVLLTRSKAFTICAGLVMLGSSGHAQNFVTNSSFQNDEAGWSWWTDSTDVVGSHAVDNAVTHWDANSVKLTYSSAADVGFAIYFQDVSGLTVGQQYYAYAWVKGSGVGSSAQFAARNDWSARVPIPAGTYSDWTLIELPFIADGTTSRV